MAIFPSATRIVPQLADRIARGLTELIRLAIRIAGGNVDPQPICLNSICALPASNLVIDSTIFHRTLAQGLTVLLSIVAVAVVLFLAQAAYRVVFRGTRTAAVLRRVVTARTLALLLAGALFVSAAVAVLANLRGLSKMAPPSRGMEWAEME